jgi:hypothetical protein
MSKFASSFMLRTKVRKNLFISSAFGAIASSFEIYVVSRTAALPSRQFARAARAQLWSPQPKFQASPFYNDGLL